MYRKILYLLPLSVLFIGLNLFFANANKTDIHAEAANFNPSNLISDGNFINIGKMNTAAIQRFLESKNSYLKNFSEGGRSAANYKGCSTRHVRSGRFSKRDYN